MTGTEFFLWRAGSFTVRVSLEFVDRLKAALADPHRTASEEHGGILLGALTGPQFVDITGFEFQPSEHRRGIAYDLGARERSRVARYVAGLRRRTKTKPVGYFRTHLRPGLFLDQDDFALMEESFADPNSVALLIGPSQEIPPRAGFFFWEEGDIDRKQTRSPFPFDSETLRARGTIEYEQSRTESPRNFSVNRWWPAAVAVGASLAVLAAAVHQRPRAVVNPMNLQVARQGNGVLLNWNAKAPAVAHARQAVVTIKDGETAEKVTLGKRELDRGSMEFIPKTNHVAVRMDVASTREAIRAVYVEPPPASIEAAPLQTAPVLRPAVVIPPRPRERRVNVAVSLETKQSSEFRRVVGHIPLLGHIQPLHADRGGDFIPARPERPLKPRVPEYMVADLSHELPVDVRVSIDKHGAVRDTEVLTGQGTSFGLIAADSAGSVEWAPARVGDRNVATEVIVHYRFRPE